MAKEGNLEAPTRHPLGGAADTPPIGSSRTLGPRAPQVLECALEPGDVVAEGTKAGVAHAAKPAAERTREVTMVAVHRRPALAYLAELRRGPSTRACRPRVRTGLAVAVIALVRPMWRPAGARAMERAELRNYEHPRAALAGARVGPCTVRARSPRRRH